MTRNALHIRIALGTILIVGSLVVVPAAVAAHGGGGKPSGGKTSCTQNAPGVAVQNNYQWGQWGSWGLPGQQLTYLIDVINYDAGCGSSTFTVNISAPGGFSVSPATSTVSLNSGASAYVWAHVTSPSVIADGDYPLTVTASRTGTTAAVSTGSFVSYYKVYSSDSVAPTLYWPNPGDGTTITGRSYNMAVSASDDHAVKTIDLYIDDVLKSETLCDDIAYTCSLNYSWATSSGYHTAKFVATDWKGNVGVLPVGFTVG